MSLSARDFPPGTPLCHFFAWNEGKPRWRRDRRYRLFRNPELLPISVAQALQAAIGDADPAAHAAVFAAFEQAARPAGARRRRILVIRLSALGDFIQALGPIAAIRRHHAGDHVSLLTTRPLAGFAEELGYFDEVIVDQRPGMLAFSGWLNLRRRLRRDRFDRVYDLQTSTRSAAYAWLLRPGMPEWSGIAWRCSHPHANRDRDPQHTLDKQTEQLLMAGIYPTPLPSLPPLHRDLPRELMGRDFVLLVPGSSPTHPEKRWPAECFGAVARALDETGYRAVIVGTATEAPLAVRIRDACPAALDLTGQTDLGLVGALAQRAALTIGNDTGVCHLAAAAGCAAVVLFSGGTDPARCAPRGRLVEVIAASDLRDLTPDPVISAAAEILVRRRRDKRQASGLR
ncbi:MAG: glycosyltransferase family 9 protein [Alphaproteobacteria bacterium]